MNNDQDYNQPNTYQPPALPASPPEPAQPAWQAPPTQPITAPAQPAVELARQQLANVYNPGHTTSAAQVAAPNPPVPTSMPSTAPTSVAPVMPAPKPTYYNPYQQPVSGYNPPVNESPAPTTPTQPMQFGVQSAPIHGQIDEPERSVAEIKQQLLNNVRNSSERKPLSRWKPILTALIVGFVFLSVNYNQVALAQIRQYVSPSSSLSTPVIVDPNSDIKISNDPRLIIPKINVDVPVVYDEKTYDEARIQRALEEGVVHYGDTGLPGQIGNNVIVGHSSNNFFNGGRYKFAFVLLDRLEKDDTFILHYKGERYIYKVFNKEIIEPNDFSLIQPTDKPVVTLITCTPPGTAWHRLVVQAEQISPSTADAKPANTHIPDNIDSPVPGNAPSLWSRFWDSF